MDSEYITDDDVEELVEILFRNRDEKRLNPTDMSKFDLLDEKIGFFILRICQHSVRDLKLVKHAANLAYHRTLLEIGEAASSVGYGSELKRKLWGAASPKVWLYQKACEIVRYQTDLLHAGRSTSNLIRDLVMFIRSPRDWWSETEVYRSSPPRTSNGIGASCRLRQREQNDRVEREPECTLSCELLFLAEEGIDFNYGDVSKVLGLGQSTVKRYFQQCRKQQRESSVPTSTGLAP